MKWHGQLFFSTGFLIDPNKFRRAFPPEYDYLPLLLSPFKLGFRYFKLDVHLVTVTQINPLNQSGHDHMLCFCVGLVEAFGPGKQLIDLGFCFLRILCLCFKPGFCRCKDPLINIRSI